MTIYFVKTNKMLEVFIILIIIILIVGLCLHHHSMKKQINTAGDEDSDLVKKSAEASIIAANTMNPIVSLVEITKAVQMIECLHSRYGPDKASDITKVNTRDLLNVLQNQKDKIMQDITKSWPQSLPKHPLAAHAGMIPGETRMEYSN